MVGAQENLCFRQRARLWEGERESTYLCMPAALSLYLFLFSSSKIPLSYLFSYCFFFFLILVFISLFSNSQSPNAMSLSLCTRQRAPFIVPVVTGFYYFGPQQPFSGLGVLANHHWFVCVPFLIARQRKIILFVCLLWHPFLLWSGCLLSPYTSWHAPRGSNSALLLLGGLSSQQDTSPKRARVETSK